MTAPAQFTFLLLPGFNLAALGAACAVLTEEAAHIEFATATLEGRSVIASCAVRVRPDTHTDEIDADTVLVVLSGRDLPDDTREAALAVLRRARRKNTPLWAIGAGVVLLAAAGLPEGARVVAHPDLAGRIRARARRVEVAHGPFLWSEALATARAAGAAALFRHALAQARIAAEESEGAKRSEAARSQLEPVIDRYDTTQKTVLAGLAIMRENLFRPVSIGALAVRLGVSHRQLERLYEKELGDSPAPIYREMRMEAARIEVRDGRRPMHAIAEDFGMSPAGFSKIYLKQFGVAPSADRRAVIEASR
jgi:transcriptional regulator GlxA family with amidase domain